MKYNTRFPIAVHILVFVAVLGKKHSTSENIAKSVNTNPVIIRRINAMLKKANLICISQGVSGIQLNLDSATITLLDIYRAVNSVDDSLFELHHSPNPNCKIGGHIHEALAGPLYEAQRSLERTLEGFTLADIISQLQNRK